MFHRARASFLTSLFLLLAACSGAAGGSGAKVVVVGSMQPQR